MAFEKEGSYGYLSLDGKVAIGAKYDTLWHFNEYGQTEAGLKGKYGVLDRDGKIAVPFKYDSIEWVSKNQLGPGLTEIVLKASETGLPGLIVAMVHIKPYFITWTVRSCLSLKSLRLPI